MGDGYNGDEDDETKNQDKDEEKNDDKGNGYAEDKGPEKSKDGKQSPRRSGRNKTPTNQDVHDPSHFSKDGGKAMVKVKPTEVKLKLSQPRQ